MAKNTMPNVVYETLKNEILNMELKPGTSIGEIDMSNRFDVSRTPVRDAIRRLESDGLLEVKSHIGTYVSKIDLDQVIDVIYMREKIEKAIIEEICNNPKMINSFKIDFNLNEQKELLESDHEDLTREFMKLDNAYHELLFTMVGRQNIWSYLQNIEYQYDRFRIFLNNDKNKLQRIYEEHLEILKYMHEGNVTEALKAYEDHLYHDVNHSTKEIFDNKEYFTTFDI